MDIRTMKPRKYPVHVTVYLDDEELGRVNILPGAKESYLNQLADTIEKSAAMFRGKVAYRETNRRACDMCDAVLEHMK